MDIEPFTWDDLRVLLAVHRHGSFLAAGRALSLSTSTVARRIHAVESALGRPVVIRSTTGTAVEAEAVELVRLAESMELGLQAARRTAEAMEGTVRISAGEGFAGPLVEVLARLRRRHPRLMVELVAESRAVDLSRREADVGLRTVRTRSAVLVERPLGQVSFALYAARALVELRLRTTTPTAAELSSLEVVGFTGPLEASPQSRWLAALTGRRPVFRISGDGLALQAIRLGQGAGVLPVLVGDADPSLVRLSVSPGPPRVPVWLVFHRELRKVPRVRLVVEAIESEVKTRL